LFRTLLQRLRRPGRLGWLLLALLLSLALLRLSIDRRERLARALEPSQAAMAPAAAASGLLRQALAGEQGELARLRQELAVLRMEYRQVKEAYERDHRAQEGVSRALRHLIPAGLLARDPALWFKALTLDVGRDDGVVDDAGVISPLGVLGKVTFVGASSCRIQLLSDPACRLAARLPRSGLHCAVAGDGRRGALLQYLGGQDDVRVGDKVETGPGSSSFPSGVPVGTVTRLLKLEGGLKLVAELEPSADLSRLDSLFVVGARP
jgi:rod shape-determining protein MreC